MRAFQTVGVACFLGLSFVGSSLAATRYVNVSNATPAAPYTNWGMAATAIQPAINEASNGDEILVAPGTYLLSGNAVMVPSILPATNTLTLRSTQSRAAIIDAQGLSPGLLLYGTNCLAEGFTIRNGFRDNYGGGALVMAGSTLRDCLIVSNSTTAGGGGVQIYEYGIVENCTIQSNVAGTIGGGVLFYNGATGVVRNCAIRDNVVTGNFGSGGGVYIQNGGMVSNCWISGNSVTATNGDGGGVFMSNQGSPIQSPLVNSVIFGNHAGRNGGGVYSVGPAGTLSPVINCTIVSNTAGVDGGGVNASTTRLINDIIYGNSAPTNANLCTDGTGSIVSNCCTTVNYGWPCITNAPAFVDAGAGDFRLATASFCIDAGTTNGAPGRDIEGNPRPRIGKPGMGITNCDMGAYEYGFHFNDIRFTDAATVQLLWDVQDRGIYRLDAETNGLGNPIWMNVLAYTNAGMAAGQFVVHTQTVAIQQPVPIKADFRLSISHTLGKRRGR